MELPYQTTPYSTDTGRRPTFEFDSRRLQNNRMRDPIDLASWLKKKQHGRAPGLKIACLTPTGTEDESKCNRLTCGGVTQVSCVRKNGLRHRKVVPVENFLLDLDCLLTARIIVKKTKGMFSQT